MPETQHDTDPAEALWRHVEIWKSAAAEASVLLRTLEAAEWDLPTELPGWDVRAVASHLAHLESELAGIKQPAVDVPDAPHIVGPMNQFTEQGPIVRRDWMPEEIVSEFGQAVAIRYEKLLSDPPQEPDDLAPGFAGQIGWTWRTLLSNRPLDIWMHEQDIRRATGRPGGLSSAGADHATEVFAGALPFVFAKRVQAPAGASLMLQIRGARVATYGVIVGDDGRGQATAEPVEQPTVRITLDFADWIALAGGRVGAEQVAAEIEGDADLGQRALNAMTLTP